MTRGAEIRMAAPVLDSIGRDGADGRDRIVDVYRTADGHYRLVEACDEYFSAVLTPAELRQLGMELIAIADSQ